MGRKNNIIMGMFICLISTFMLSFSQNISFIYIGLFIGGLSVHKNFTLFILCSEILEEKDKMNATTWCLSSDSLISMIPAAIILLSGAKSTEFIPVLSIIIATTTLIGSFFIPESPRYLYERKEYSKLRKTLLRIAKFNGVEMGEFKIQGEEDSRFIKGIHSIHL